MARIERTEQAEKDIDEILDYLDDHSRPAAIRFAKLFKEKTEALSRMPEMGRSRGELGASLRSFSAGAYLIFYRPITDGIQVIRVAHGSRDLKRLFGG